MEPFLGLVDVRRHFRLDRGLGYWQQDLVALDAARESVCLRRAEGLDHLLRLGERVVALHQQDAELAPPSCAALLDVGVLGQQRPPLAQSIGDQRAIV